MWFFVAQAKHQITTYLARPKDNEHVEVSYRQVRHVLVNSHNFRPQIAGHLQCHTGLLLFSLLLKDLALQKNRPCQFKFIYFCIELVRLKIFIDLVAENNLANVNKDPHEKTLLTLLLRTSRNVTCVLRSCTQYRRFDDSEGRRYR